MARTKTNTLKSLSNLGRLRHASILIWILYLLCVFSRFTTVESHWVTHKAWALFNFLADLWHDCKFLYLRPCKAAVSDATVLPFAHHVSHCLNMTSLRFHWLPNWRALVTKSIASSTFPSRPASHRTPRAEPLQHGGNYWEKARSDTEGTRWKQPPKRSTLGSWDERSHWRCPCPPLPYWAELSWPGWVQ